MFVDASATVAILTGEDDARDLAATLEAAKEPLSPPIAVCEPAVSIARKTGRRAEAELPDVLSFLEVSGVQIVPVDMAVTAAAVATFDRYGRRGGHPADLNMGDCVAYAFAKARNTSLLYKGKDFSRTDVRQA